MFFEKEILSFHILDVLKITQKNVNMSNVGRNFNALSFRLRSDAILKTNSENYRLGDDYVSYFPARLDYVRNATIDEMIVVHFDSTDYHTEKLEFFKTARPEKMRALFEKLFACWEKKELGYMYRSSAILYEIFAECYAQNYKVQTSESKIQKSMDYIFKNFKSPSLSIGEIAKQSFISEVYFRKLFKIEYGVSPQKFIIQLRIQNAKGLIATGYYSLKEIAYLSGYTDYKYFSVEFKTMLGVSPSEYSYNFNK